MSADRESIIPELPQVVQRQPPGLFPPPYLCNQSGKISKNFSLITLNSKFGHYWSKSQLFRTPLAKVIKIALLCYQPSKISKILAQSPSTKSLSIWSKFQLSTITQAKVSKIVLLCYQPSKISKFFGPTAYPF